MVLLFALGWVKFYNQEFLQEDLPLVFSEEREPAVLTLDLSHCALEREAKP